MKKLLVTGARGFIGSHVLEQLANEAAVEVHATTARPIRRRPPGASQWHVVDLLDTNATAELIYNLAPSHLLHLAWNTDPASYRETRQNLEWAAGSFRLIEAFVAAGGERFVFAGTCMQYDWRYGYCSEGVTPLGARNLYAVTKTAVESSLFALASSDPSFSAASGRIFFPYGPGERPERLVPSIILSLLRGDPAHVRSGAQYLDFLHVADVARALVALLKSPIEGPVNIGSGEPVRIGDLAQWLAVNMNREELLQIGAADQGGPEAAVIAAGIERLRDDVGWSPNYSLEDGIQNTIDWWQTEVTRRGN